MTRGILIMALGHPYYGRMAHNLAVSIKQAEADMSIAFVHAGDAMSHLSVFDLSKHFDKIIEAPKESYTKNGKPEWIKAKTRMYDLSPWDETIFIDADALWLNQKPSTLFDKLRDIDFTIQNRGCTSIDKGGDSYSPWAKLSDIRSAYDLTDEQFYSVSSEFVYFKKSDRITALFNSVKDNYDSLKVGHKEFAGAIPDELCFIIAMMQHKIYPHAKMFTPVYWQLVEKKIPDDLYSNYFAISAGGKYSGDWTKRIYDRLVCSYFGSAGLRYIWKLQHKRSFLPERAKI